MRPIIVIASVAAAVLVGAGAAAAIASALESENSHSVVGVDPLVVTPSEAPPATSPTPRPTESGAVTVTPPESHDIGDDHGGRGENSGHGGGSDDSDKSGHGGGDD